MGWFATAELFVDVFVQHLDRGAVPSPVDVAERRSYGHDRDKDHGVRRPPAIALAVRPFSHGGGEGVLHVR